MPDKQCLVWMVTFDGYLSKGVDLIVLFPVDLDLDSHVSDGADIFHF